MAEWITEVEGMLGAYKPVIVESSVLTKSSVMDELSGTCKAKVSACISFRSRAFRLAGGQGIEGLLGLA